MTVGNRYRRAALWLLRVGCILLLPSVLAACARPASLLRLDGETMGTTWSAQFADRPGLDRSAVLTAIQAELDRVIEQMSTWQPDSAISRYNIAPADTWHDIPDAFSEVLDAALTLARATDGSYDPTIGPLVDAWGFGAGRPIDAPPTDDVIAAAKGRVDWRRVRLDTSGKRLWQPGGVQLDLSSIAEGYAVDRMGRALEEQGIVDYLVEIGGELRARGQRPDELPWRIAVEQPEIDGTPTQIVPLRDASIATSGDYRKFFEYQGRRFSHAIDPHTGWPVDHGLASVTLVSADCMDAGATATALSVLGPERGYDYALGHGFAARFVVRHDTGLIVRDTPAFQALIAAE